MNLCFDKDTLRTSSIKKCLSNNCDRMENLNVTMSNFVSDTSLL